VAPPRAEDVEEADSGSFDMEKAQRLCISSNVSGGDADLWLIL